MQRKSKILSLILSLVFIFALGLTACGGGGSNDNSGDEDDDVAIVRFWGDGEETEQAVFRTLTEKFNNAHDGEIYVIYDYQSNMGQSLEGVIGTTSCADVIYVGDGSYKKYVEQGYLADITSYVNRSTIINTSDMWDSIYDRYFYSVENHRAGSAAQNGKWYGLPKDIGPTVLYYNETWFNNANVYVISCYEADLAAFNAGGYDAYGNRKTEVKSADGLSYKTITGTVPAKGFFEDNGNYFFNNKIAMSWEETRQLSRLLENNRVNTEAKDVKGYHTEWWFNYGWSVGGDCIEYVETADAAYTGGFYDFTLVDDTKNFIVKDDYAGTITVNGHGYKAGEIISYADKLKNEEALAGKIVRKNDAVYDDTVTAQVAAGNIYELPSQRDAFVEFVLLSSDPSVEIDGKNGYDICMKPTSMGGDGTKASGFTEQTIGMLVDGRWNVTNFRTDAVKFAWDVAPLPIYKEYRTDGTVVHGVTAGHSGSVSLSINQYSSVKDAAWKFVEYIAGPEGQKDQSLQGFAIPSQKYLATNPTNNGTKGGQPCGVFLNQRDSAGGLLRPYNAEIFIAAAECEHEGDWAYLKTGSDWIDAWADDLNSKVRNATMTFDEFVTGAAFTHTFEVIKEYTKK